MTHVLDESDDTENCLTSDSIPEIPLSSFVREQYLNLKYVDTGKLSYNLYRSHK